MVLLLICLSLLSACGLIGQFSSAGGNVHPFVFHQLIVFSISLPVMIIIWHTNIDFCVEKAHIFYVFCILLLLIVAISGRNSSGVIRWIRFHNITIQPSEITKVAVILMLAKHFSSRKSHQIRSFLSFAQAGFITVIPSILILKQPNLGTTIVLCLIALGITFATPVKLRYIFGLLGLVMVSLPLSWSFLHDYQKKRIISFLNPERDPLGIGYNTMQSKIAIGSGSVFGTGFINGTQTQLNFLPEKQTDFIFTVISEEWGFVGAMLVMIIYSILVYTSLDIAFKSPKYSHKLIAVGVSCLFMAHFFMNIGMVTGLLPVVGVPLPILSYGGSITLTSLSSIGMLLSITKNNLLCNKNEYI